MSRIQAYCWLIAIMGGLIAIVSLPFWVGDEPVWYSGGFVLFVIGGVVAVSGLGGVYWLTRDEMLANYREVQNKQKETV